ncbi:ABC transporter ATP-binding protein [Microbacterium sp. No. 7]|uniref:ABC transporter ATP-binding protein n=1 Tax=Microbacterium sp. No. 7 TaxID=1714373 RepID=UPI0006ED08F6|nr:ABC transporter ATP-binding protein [Microbacterium sp. No. 7]ALJ18893.1 hypothetical protein AOA12_02795 [Microbacterium sp. No. 7]
MTQQSTITPETGKAATAPPAALTIENVTKSFKRANGTLIKPVDDISLTIAEGEFIVLLGPSGCGKTTLLRCIAGLESPDEGAIDILGSRVVQKGAGAREIEVAPERRKLGMIFQSYALWPHLTVARNVSYPLESAKVPRAERRERVERALAMVGVSEVAGQLPGRLSGGQQQRVSLARALVGEPRLILFDEPLSNVDAKVREELRLQLVEMQARIGFTAIYVTHDQAEAMELADRVAVLRNGRIAQLDRPEVVYEHPASRYVAKFVGVANEVRARVTRVGDDTLVAHVGGVEHDQVLPLPTGGRAVAAGDDVYVIWRPERTVLGEPADRPGLRIPGEFLLSRFLGSHSEAIVDTGDGEIRVQTPRTVSLARGERVHVHVDVDDLRVFPVEDER